MMNEDETLEVGFFVKLPKSLLPFIRGKDFAKVIIRGMAWPIHSVVRRSKRPMNREPTGEKAKEMYGEDAE